MFVCWRLVRGLFYPVSGWFGRVGGLSEGVLSSRWVFWALNVREALFSSTVWMFFGRLSCFLASVLSSRWVVWVCGRLVRGCFYPVSG